MYQKNDLTKIESRKVHGENTPISDCLSALPAKEIENKSPEAKRGFCRFLSCIFTRSANDFRRPDTLRHRHRDSYYVHHRCVLYADGPY